MASEDRADVEPRGQFNVTLEDLIATAVRAANLSESHQITNNELQNLIPEFSGSPEENVDQWFKRIDKVQDRRLEAPVLSTNERIRGLQTTPDSTTTTMMITEKKPNIYEIPVKLQLDEEGSSISVQAMLDTGSPISIIKAQYLPTYAYSTDLNNFNKDFYGVNGAKLNIVGIFDRKVFVNDRPMNIVFHVVADDTMSFPAILGRDFTSLPNIKVVLGDTLVVTYYDYANCDDQYENTELEEIMLIDCNVKEGDLNINPKLDYVTKSDVETRMLLEYDDDDDKFEFENESDLDENDHVEVCSEYSDNEDVSGGESEQETNENEYGE
ncbi:hypothetical protein RN001_008862 [Aquatica leii]|uniref:Peptidase A2 domain-containing protein n=1 Tax=Aquatica leii TaxID=1421715 RepID=A0AAN7PHT3_9COLE|nr:hypothetical protein RN001_008862 [Aquatica leii]